MSERKYWIFYTLSSIKSLAEYDKHSLYAFTDDETCMNNFIHTRNMDLFYVKKVKLEADDYNNLNHMYTNRLLEMITIPSIDSNYKIQELDIALTQTELRRCNIDSMIYTSDILQKYAWCDYVIFKDKYIQSLHTLVYTACHNYLTDNITDDEDDIDIIPNIFNILLKNYKELFIKSKNNED